MEIVIKVPDGIYDFLKEHPDRQFPYATEWLRQGTPLPKGHGRLIDADALDDNCDWCHTDDDGSWCYKCKDIDNAPTVIEADKEDE